MLAQGAQFRNLGSGKDRNRRCPRLEALKFLADFGGPPLVGAGSPCPWGLEPHPGLPVRVEPAVDVGSWSQAQTGPPRTGWEIGYAAGLPDKSRQLVR
jgi:hypothetical protein